MSEMLLIALLIAYGAGVLITGYELARRDTYDDLLPVDITVGAILWPLWLPVWLFGLFFKRLTRRAIP